MDQLLAGKPSKYNELLPTDLLPSADLAQPKDKSKSIASRLLSLDQDWRLDSLNALVLKRNISGLEWDAVLGALNYAVEESFSEQFEMPSEVYRGTATKYAPHFKLGPSRYFRVRAIGGPFLKDSEWSNSLKFTKSVNVFAEPPAPVLRFDFLKRKLTWDNVWGATGYVVERSPDPSFTKPTIIYEGTETECLVFDAPFLSRHHYQVQAKGVLEPSAWSNVVDSATGS